MCWKVNINDQVATTSVDQEFYNPNSRQLEGTYIFPLPAGAHIDKFAMDVNGKQMEAELLPADKAKAIYEDIVRRSKDPALLEYMGRDAFKVRIFPIEANGRKRVKISYTQLIKSEAGMAEYVYPLNTEKFSSKPLNNVSVKVDLTTSASLKNVYCPSHNCDIRRDGQKHAVVAFEDRNVRPDTDFKLIFTRDDKEVGINLLTYKTSGQDGYFLLMASPGAGDKSAKPEPKDIAFVVDTSGSMAGNKLNQARKALAFCLANLNETDRFEVVRFSTEAEPLFNGLVDANAANVQKATEFVNNLKPIGGTAIDDALRKVMSMKIDKNGADRPFVIIFLTDGLPTVGETREDAIVEHALKVSKDAGNVRVFSFGIGEDVNTHLLDRISDGTRAFSQYVLSNEDIEVKVSSFYAKVKEPALSNVSVAFSGGNIRTSAQYPTNLPDLFKGQQLLVFGRYTGSGPAAVKVTGTANGTQREYVSDVHFTDQNLTTTYIPQLWAIRRVGWLLDEIRQHGESKELKEEVIRLARDHGIVTPYTAFLIVEDEARRNVPLAFRNMRELESDNGARQNVAQDYDRLKAESASESARSGAGAVANAQQLNRFKQSDSVAAPRQRNQADESLTKRPVTNVPGSIDGPIAGYRQAQTYTQQARVVNGRAFYQNGDTWTDSTAQSQKDIKRQEIKFNSDEYFALIAKYPAMTPWFSLGDKVDIVIDGTLYVIR